MKKEPMETAARILDVIIISTGLKVDETARFKAEDKVVEILRTRFYR